MSLLVARASLEAPSVSSGLCMEISFLLDAGSHYSGPGIEPQDKALVFAPQWMESYSQLHQQELEKGCGDCQIPRLMQTCDSLCK